MNRREYAIDNRSRYLHYLAEVEASPYGPLDMAEFAVISAHCNMERAIDGFLATRDPELDMRRIADRLDLWGVFAPYNKAAYIDRLRVDMAPLPHPDYRDFRRREKLPGLGFAKLSFAACLGDPFGCDIVCLDTHMLQMYDIPIAEHGRYFSSRARYESVEFKLLH